MRKEPEKGYVNTDLIPAAVYKAAIEHYSLKSLHNNLRLEAEGNNINVNVEKFALRPMLADPAVPGTVECWPQMAIRNSTILFLGDSGTFIYKSISNIKIHDSVDEFVRGTTDGNWTSVKSRWHHLNGIHGCGAGWANWFEGMHIVINKAIKENIPEYDSDGQERFPSWYHVVCFDNLSSLAATILLKRTKRLSYKRPKPRTTYGGFMENGLLQSELSELMKCLGKFKSCVYVRTAPASRWNLPQEVDKITTEIVRRATEYKVTCIRSESFWHSIVQFATPKSAQWHHAHAKGNDRFLRYHWDRMLFRVISFSKACTIHPAVLGSICDHKAYEKLYEEIKRAEVLDNPPQQGGSSFSKAPIGTKVEDVAPDIMPASHSYSESLGASHGTEDTKKFVKRRWTDYASDKEEQGPGRRGSSRRGRSLDSEEEALKNEEVIRDRMDRLN